MNIVITSYLKVTVLASSVETYVKSQEHRQEQDRQQELGQVTSRLEEVRAEVGAALGRLGRIDEDNLVLLEKLNSLDSRLVGLDTKDGQLDARLGQLAGDLGGRITGMDSESAVQREKVQQLEDAYTLQVGVRARQPLTPGFRLRKPATLSCWAARCP